MQKLYCYVDETGQDTLAQPEKKRAVFVVGMVILDGEQQSLESVCIEYEKRSGKGITPWHKAKYVFRLEYLRLVIADRRFAGTLFYRIFPQPTKTFFDTYILQAVASVVGTRLGDVTTLKEIYVDGLTRTKQSVYAVELRRIGGQRASFHRATDQGNPFIRLADAVAGLVREALDDRASEAAQVLQQGKRVDVIREVE